MKKVSVILSLVASVACIGSLCIADVPKGFSNAQDATRLKEAWENKALLITFTDFERDIVGEKGACWEFNDFKKAKVYIIKRDGSKILKAKGSVDLMEYINVDSPGYKPGEYVMQFVATGYTFGTGFEDPIDPEAESFKDKKQRVFEIMPQGCSGD